MRIDLKLGFVCNNYCRFCVQGDKRKEIPPLSTDEAIKKIEQYREKGNSIVFTGGEVTLREDLIELIRYTRKLGYTKIQIQTNARMLADYNYAKKLVEAGANEFSPAIHGHKPEIHDYLTRAPGSFKQTIMGIINLKKLNQKVITNTVITRSNFEFLPDIAKLLVKLKVDQFQFAFVHPIGNAYKNFFNIVPRLTIIMPYVKQGLLIGKKAGIPAFTEAIPYCFMRGFEDCIAENIIPSTIIVEPESVVEDYTQVRRNEGKAKGDVCIKCKLNHLCEGPWKEYPEKYGWEEFTPVF